MSGLISVSGWLNFWICTILVVMSVDASQSSNKLVQARNVIIMVLGLNLLVSGMEISWAWHTHTLSLMADGFHSLMDAVSSAVGIVGLSVAIQPPDENHPYGHRKFESMAAIFISFFIFLTCWEIVSEAIGRATDPEREQAVFSYGSYVVKIIVLGINIFVTWFEGKKAKELNSSLLKADATHTMTDIYVSLTVLVSIFALQMGWYWVDWVVAIAVAIIIVYAGYEVLSQHLGSLLDEAVLDSTEIQQIAYSVDGVKGCHRVRSRGMQEVVFVDMHIQVDPEMSVRDAHDIAHQVEDKLIERFGERLKEVLIHVEEEGDDDQLLPSDDSKMSG